MNTVKQGKNKKRKKKKIRYPFSKMMLVTVGAAMLLSEEIGVRSVCQELETYMGEKTTQPGDRIVELDESLMAKLELDGYAAEAEAEHETGQELSWEILQPAPKKQAEPEVSLRIPAPSGEPEKTETENLLSENENAGIMQETENTKLNQDLNNNICNETDCTEKAENTDICEGEDPEEIQTGTTRFEYYEPLEIDSRYYSDAGKVAMTTDYPYETVELSYFDDAAFIGDSRTVGISDYAGFDNSDFYCESSMTVFKVLDDKGIICQETGRKVDLKEVLSQKQYGKIYLMLGINELGYGNTQMFLEKYEETLQSIRQWQPDAVIYIMANLHISEAKNRPDTEFNNVNINDKNAAIATLADGKDIFYLDSNPFFTDNDGFLKEDITFDGVHLYAQFYAQWKGFLMEHAVVR